MTSWPPAASLLLMAPYISVVAPKGATWPSLGNPGLDRQTYFCKSRKIYIAILSVGFIEFFKISFIIVIVKYAFADFTLMKKVVFIN